MSSKGLPGFANSLAIASELSAALGALYEEAADTDRSASVALLRNDPRRDLFFERILVDSGGVRRDDIAVSFDHLPVQVRKRVSSGQAFVEFGDQSTDFMKLLGLPASEGATLAMRGFCLDNELAGALALVEPKRRFGGRVLDKLVPAAEMFGLAYARLHEHDARLEAVRTLEDITRSIHTEYERTVSELEKRLHSAQDASLAGGSPDSGRAAELERALHTALNQSRVTAQKLAAVDQQVSTAVSKLERAHMELHQQTEIARRHSDLIHTVRQRLESALESPDPRAAIDDLLRSLRNYE
ncbi:MAG: hypothetical protein H0U64_00690 [Gemmatimonadaceae bacterium]|nr:hypothetical protein [Gemmatimonadaceae bacterium]